MGQFINRFATPLITGFFVVSAVSGVALFFHWVPGAFHAMHVWLSMVLLLPFLLHIWKNWRPLLAYAKRGTLVVPLLACLAVAVPFAVSGLSGGGRGGNPAFRTVALMTQARISEVAPVLKTTPDALLAALKQRGYQARSADETLDAIAAASGKPASEVLLAVIPAH
ncbi:hypothetical protein DES32_0334 [Methylovirgula ligni]|uniref:DUF4405 domain-containing protein n=1 Tax=Methylovirgula ligni TaxID=569860 RepID=A0A3D9Z6F3_9HYPH|nr:DUF4405 domain-containing protein [Methylovirgula ligni]REF89119.1 hypothetical protein DES32_0334 [Methylovirgula ligni]